MNRFFASLLLACATFQVGYAQQDSVVIKGKILNLNGKLYRQAPSITFSRNNILAASNELSVNADLQPDGSFRASLPLLAASEEIYLDYGGQVFTTFLAKAGELEITFDADSMFKTARLFRFRGVNANANNYYPYYLDQEKKLFEANRSLGADFERSFWNQGLQGAKQSLLQRGNLRQRALTALLSEGKQSDELSEWVNSIVEDERATFLMEYSLANLIELGAADDADVKRFGTSPLTYQKVMRVNRFREYATRSANIRMPQSRRNASSLPVDRIARLVLRYVAPLTSAETDKLNLIVQKKNVDREELDLLSRLYKRGGAALATVASFERNNTPVMEAYEGPTRELLLAAAFADDFFRYDLDEKAALYQDLQQNMQNAGLKRSLAELYRMEVKDSADIRLAEKAALTKVPSEVLPGIWLAQSNMNGKTWVEDVQKLYLGRPVYVVNWDMYSDACKEDIAFIPALRSQLPEDVVFLFLHTSDPDRAQVTDEGFDSGERKLWKQFIVRNRLTGTHLFLDPEQVFQMNYRTPSLPGTYYIIRPDGRYHSRNAPSPAKIEEVVKAIREARQK